MAESMSCKLSVVHEIPYDNPDMVKMKANYVREMGLGGIFFWTGAASVQSGGDRSLAMSLYTPSCKEENMCTLF